MRCWGSNGDGQVIFCFCYLSLEGCGVDLREAVFSLTPCVFEQLGDNSNSHKSTPVNVSGLASGVVSVALGQVSFLALFVMSLFPLF